jgi:hypothetical protein
MVFRRLKDAKKFQRLQTCGYVYRCHAKNPKKMHRVAKYRHGVKIFWMYRRGHQMPAPEGTYCAESVKLISEVK